MTTREIVTLVKYQAEKWNRTGLPGILPILNQAQNLLYQFEHEQNVALDAQGDFPFVATQDNVFNYDLPADCWRPVEILISATLYSDGYYGYLFDSQIIQDYDERINLQRPVDEVFYNGKRYWRWQQIKSKDQRIGEGQTNNLIFRLNPGDTTEKYRLRYYKRPTQITAETIQPTIPEPYDFEFLVPATMKLIEGFQNGTIAEMMDYVTLKLAPRFWFKIQAGMQGQSYHQARRQI